MFEHTSLYEAYTGSLIAAKGKNLNGIKAILEPCRFKHEDWARVRFGAGTPWVRKIVQLWGSFYILNNIFSDDVGVWLLPQTKRRSSGRGKR